MIAQLVRNDDTRRKQLIDQIRMYRETLFSRENQQTVLKPLIDQMQALLVGFGVPNAGGGDRFSATTTAAGRIGRHTSLRVCPAPPTRCTSSSTTPVTACMPAIPSRFRRARRPQRTSRSTTNRCSTTIDPTDLWVLNDLGTGKSLTNQAFNRVLHASGTQVTGQGHKFLYTCAPSNGDHAEEFTIVPVPVPVTDPANPPGRFAYTGYFNLVSVRTN